ncbi:MAG: succinate dehydrogenase [Puniceicoccaceae bacterium MED-G32]|nr:MAG: succinate dehydrogenase [Puniceicoccaceae bacterium MED-G32]
MISVRQYLQSSLGRKWLMAITGLVLVLFVMGHMLGNLLIYLGPDALNAYAYKLHSIPDPIMAFIRLSLLVAVGVHIWMAVLLTLENKKAKPLSFKNKVKSSYASRTMRMSGVILLSFIIFHLLHYTVRVVPTMEYNDNVVFSDIAGNSNYVPLYKEAHPVIKHGEAVQTFNVYDMLIHGFKNPYVSFFYILSVGLLCLHLAHGISSLFQTFGLRNTVWRVRLDRIGLAYGLVVFLGFASIPLATQLNLLKYSWESTETINSISQSIDIYQSSSD